MNIVASKVKWILCIVYLLFGGQRNSHLEPACKLLKPFSKERERIREKEGRKECLTLN